MLQNRMNILSQTTIRGNNASEFGRMFFMFGALKRLQIS